MKKYLWIIAILVAIFLGYEIAVYQFGLYIHQFTDEEIIAPVSVKGKDIFVNDTVFEAATKSKKAKIYPDVIVL